VFHFYGRKWPVDDDASGMTPTAPLQALPLLEELVWECNHMVDGFAGAQPIVLHAPHHAIAEFVVASQGAGCGPLARVRSLRIDGYLPQPPEIAAVLRAVPELRELCAGWVYDCLRWYNDPAFARLVHQKLRSLLFKSEFECLTRAEFDRFAAEYDELQASHFPRLRAFILE
jgi:hypothetical protein